MGKRKYYAVFKGRVDEPTIFSSWADAHPRVTGCPGATHHGFATIEEARRYMENRRVTNPKEIIKEGAGETRPINNSEAIHAIAYGKNPGIHFNWDETSENVKGFDDNCHKKFRTVAQAEAFMEDWKQSFADVYGREIKKALDKGYRPLNMEMGVEGILHKTGTEAESAGVLGGLNFD